MEVYVVNQPIEEMEPEELEQQLRSALEGYLWVSAHISNLGQRPEEPRQPDVPMSIAQYVEWKQRCRIAREAADVWCSRERKLTCEQNAYATQLGGLIGGTWLIVPAFAGSYEVWASGSKVKVEVRIAATEKVALSQPLPESDEDYPDPDVYYAEQERQHHATLDAIEAEREERLRLDEEDDYYDTWDAIIEEESARERVKLDVSMWARRMLDSNCLILDTETTGLNDGEIVQIAVIDCNGEALLDYLVKPTFPIPAGATAIHGITDADVANAPGWDVISKALVPLLQGRDLVVYNAKYDRKMMHQSAEKARLPKTDWKAVCNWHCAMEQYAAFYGDWNDWHGSYRWQKLTDACWQMGIPAPDAPAHSALGDCLRTLALLKKMAAWQPTPEA